MSLGLLAEVRVSLEHAGPRGRARHPHEGMGKKLLYHLGSKF